MNITVLGATKIGSNFEPDDAIMLAGLEAGICYMPDNYFKRLHSREELLNRGVSTARDGHHSVFDHSVVNLLLEGVPKALAIYLNNLGVYTTSEKSARYTAMQNLSVLEKNLYQKWLHVFMAEIAEQYPFIKGKALEKLAMENARCFISVFTPATTLGYTASVRQLNYVVYWIEHMLKRAPENPFEAQAWSYLEEFVERLKAVVRIEYLEDVKGRKELRLFAPTCGYETHFGDVYSTHHLGSLAMFAQEQRHRTINYEILLDCGACGNDSETWHDEVYVSPLLLGNDNLVEEYVSDIWDMYADFPQGRKVLIYERGTVEAFAMKCEERLCGAVQYEIMRQTRHTLRDYWRADDLSIYARSTIEKYWLSGPRCQFGFSCTRPCVWGPGLALVRNC